MSLNVAWLRCCAAAAAVGVSIVMRALVLSYTLFSLCRHRAARRVFCFCFAAKTGQLTATLVATAAAATAQQQLQY